ncbi:MAG: VOC family protein [Saprospiraceae bacterium]|nr:VOC family protein [Saprospiraceae bacterium]
MTLLPDHIVYAVPDFDLALSYLEMKLGVKPVIGGRHLLHGTKNALINLGNQCYLEILAKDEENTTFKGTRWMGIDLITKPMITRWAVKSMDIDKGSAILKNFQSDQGNISSGERLTTDGSFLKWKMTLPTAAPEVDIVPFLLDWSASAFHPCDRMEHQCEIYDIALYHPQPEVLEGFFLSLAINKKVLYHPLPKIEVSIIGKNGLVDL